VKEIPALELRDVSYVANGKTILGSVHWTVRSGEHWAILGANGSGKTTLLKIACGYIWPNAGGEVYRQGRLLTNLPELRKSIGWVTSTLTPEIPRHEKVIRTVVSGKFAQIGLLEQFGGNAGKKDYAAARRYLSEMGCDHLREQEFGVLSQGEQQKVLIARARMTRPYLIFLDEPCAGMDPGARENFLATLRRVAQQPKIPALIYVTHHIEEILAFFKKTLVLKDGQELYGISVSIVKKKGRCWPVAQ
jgi:iron complex transport system ATP-binding protein